MADEVQVEIKSLSDFNGENSTSVMAALHSNCKPNQANQTTFSNDYVVVLKSESLTEIKKIVPQVLSALIQIAEADRVKIRT